MSYGSVEGTLYSMGRSGHNGTTLYVDNTSRWLNVTESSDAWKSPSLTSDPRYRIFYLTCIITLMVVACVANVLVLLCFTLDQTLRAGYGMFPYLCSLAAADLTVAAFGMTGMALIAWHGYWPLSYNLCIIWVIMDTASGTISIYHLFLIAWERYEAVVHPLEYLVKHGQHARRAAYITAVWLLSIGVWIPVTLFFSHNTRRLYVAHQQCYFIPVPWCVSVQCLLTFYVPLTVMLYVYIRTVTSLATRIRKQPALTPTSSLKNDPANAVNHVINDQTDSPAHPTSDNLQTKGHHNTQCTTLPINNATNGETKQTEATVMSDNSVLERLTAAKQTVHQNTRKQSVDNIKLLGVVIGAMIFCWLPFYIVWPIKAHKSHWVPALLYEYTYWVAYLNSSLNPFLYFVSNRNFRESLVRICVLQFKCWSTRRRAENV